MLKPKFFCHLILSIVLTETEEYLLKLPIPNRMPEFSQVVKMRLDFLVAKIIFWSQMVATVLFATWSAGNTEVAVHY